MEHWHPTKLMAIMALITLLTSTVGSIAAVGIGIGGLRTDIKNHAEAISMHTLQIAALVKTDAASEVDRASMRQWVRDINDMLCRVEQRQVDSLKITKDTNDRIKKTW